MKAGAVSLDGEKVIVDAMSSDLAAFPAGPGSFCAAASCEFRSRAAWRFRGAAAER